MNYLPFWIGVREEMCLVGAREHHQATILLVNVFHCCPAAYDALGRAEWEIVQVYIIYSSKQSQVGWCAGEGADLGAWDGVRTWIPCLEAC